MNEELQDITLTCVQCKQDFIYPVTEQKFFAKKGFKTPKRCRSCRAQKRQEKQNLGGGKVQGVCDSCGMDTILVEEVGMCGPCTFGEADTINGNW